MAARIEKYIKKTLDEWGEKGMFTAEQFAAKYNAKYSHYGMPSSGFFTYFLKLEKAGELEIFRNYNSRGHMYRVKEVKPDEEGDRVQ